MRLNCFLHLFYVAIAGRMQRTRASRAAAPERAGSGGVGYVLAAFLTRNGYGRCFPLSVGRGVDVARFGIAYLGDNVTDGRTVESFAAPVGGVSLPTRSGFESVAAEVVGVDGHPLLDRRIVRHGRRRVLGDGAILVEWRRRRGIHQPHTVGAHRVDVGFRARLTAQRLRARPAAD